MLRKVARVSVPKRANQFGEWVVRAWDQNGVRFPEADYFASDKADAEATARLMVNA